MENIEITPQRNIAGIKWALDALRVNTDAYALASKYYDGDHRLNFASEKFRNTFGHLLKEMSINYCPVCVDVPADRLQIDGFTVVAQDEGDAPEVDKVIQSAITEISRRNRMNKRQGEVHHEAFKAGDSYVIVDWTDDKATIHPNMAGRCAVKYDDENPGHIVQAAKWWPERGENDKRFNIRLNLYYPDRIEKYVAEAKNYSALPTKAAEFVEIEGDWFVPNPHGKVPVFHFPNNGSIGSLGRSELKDITPVQDAMNKTICDMLVGMETHALGQRYVSGLEVETDDNGNAIAPFKGGTANLWVVPPARGEDGKSLSAGEAQPVQFGEFNAANLPQFVAVAESFLRHLSGISGIPPHYFMTGAGGFPSGESLKTAEHRLTAKVEDRQVAFGNVWEDVMRFCLQVEGKGDVQLETVWKDTSPRSDKDEIENAAVKVEKLGVTKKTVLRELGYKDSEQEKMDEERDAETLKQIEYANTAVVPTVARQSAA